MDYKMNKFKDLNEAVDAQEDKAVIKEMKKLLNEAWKYGNKNLDSDWGNNSVLYALEKVIDHADKLKAK